MYIMIRDLKIKWRIDIEATDRWVRGNVSEYWRKTLLKKLAISMAILDGT